MVMASQDSARCGNSAMMGRERAPTAARPAGSANGRSAPIRFARSKSAPPFRTKQQPPAPQGGVQAHSLGPSIIPCVQDRKRIIIDRFSSSADYEDLCRLPCETKGSLVMIEPSVLDVIQSVRDQLRNDLPELAAKADQERDELAELADTIRRLDDLELCQEVSSRSDKYHMLRADAGGEHGGGGRRHVVWQPARYRKGPCLLPAQNALYSTCAGKAEGVSR